MIHSLASLLAAMVTRVRRPSLALDLSDLMVGLSSDEVFEQLFARNDH